MNASHNLRPVLGAGIWRARARRFARRLAQLRLQDMRETARAAICLLRIARSLGRVPFPRLIASLGLDHPQSPASSAEIAAVQQKVRWAHFLIPVQPNCLLDSLAAAALLQQLGRSASLAIGVTRKDGKFSAHAWLGASNESSGAYRVLWRSRVTTS